MSLSETDLETK